ncbi:MAG: histone deacetylase [Gemmatimonadota bacterium]
MKTFYCDPFVLPLPEGHRFPMEKYGLLRRRVTGQPGIELVVPEPADDRALLRVHTPGYVRAVVDGTLDRDRIRRLGFPWSAGLVERSRRSVGGTLGAARAALAEGWAANLAGGTHHAFADRGEGFCVFNDVAVAVGALRADGATGAMSVLDLDVHQGDGTASIFRDDPTVRTVSVHGRHNYPFRKVPGDRDLALPDGAGDAPFLDAVDAALDAALEIGPELLFYLAGADAFAGDRLGRLAVGREALAERDRRVFDRCAARGVPVAVVMGGGYARDVADTVAIHAHSVLEAARRWAAPHRRHRRALRTTRSPVPSSPELRPGDAP